MARDRFEDCVKSILALQPGIKAVASNGSLIFRVGIFYVEFFFKRKLYILF